MRSNKWAVYGEFGGYFTNLIDAKRCAREASKTEEHDFQAEVTLLKDGCNYIDYENGKCVRDGWTIQKPKTPKPKDKGDNDFNKADARLKEIKPTNDTPASAKSQDRADTSHTIR